VCPELTGINIVNDNFEGNFVRFFSIFSPFFTDFGQSKGIVLGAIFWGRGNCPIIPKIAALEGEKMY